MKETIDDLEYKLEQQRRKRYDDENSRRSQPSYSQNHDNHMTMEKTDRAPFEQAPETNEDQSIPWMSQGNNEPVE